MLGGWTGQKHSLDQERCKFSSSLHKTYNSFSNYVTWWFCH